MSAGKRFGVLVSIAVMAAATSAFVELETNYALAEEGPGKGKAVQPVNTQELTSWFQTGVTIYGLEQLGYDVKPRKQLSVSLIYAAMARGDVDYYAGAWWPSHKAFYENAGGEAKLTKVGVLVENAYQGYLIDKSTSEKFGITNLEDLRDPDNAKLFDTDDDGKADLIGCPPGWGCERDIEHHLDAYELRETVEHKQGDFIPLRSALETRYKAGKPILYYVYRPFSINSTLVPDQDVVWLEVPFTSLPDEKMENTTKTTLPDGRNVGFARNAIWNIGNNGFLSENPAAKRWLELVRIPIEDIEAENRLIQEGENTEADVRRHVEAWVQENADQVEEWLAEARKASE